VTPEENAAVRRLLEQRRAQGYAETVEDPTTIAFVAQVIDDDSEEVNDA
jgi:hypothetical protein